MIPNDPLYRLSRKLRHPSIGMGLGLRLGGGGAAGAGVLPAFVFEAETTAIVAAWSVAGYTATAGRKMAYDVMVKRLKVSGTWVKLYGLYMVQDSEAVSLVNLKAPGTYNLTKVSTPTFVANSYIQATSTAYYDTGIPLSVFPTDNCHISLYAPTTRAAADALDAGARTGTTGLEIGLKGSTTGGLNGRAQSTSNTTSVGSSSLYDVLGFSCVSRSNSAGVDYGYEGQIGGTRAIANTAMAVATTLFFGRSNGVTATGGSQLAWMTTGEGLSPAQQADLYGAVQTFYESQRYGDLNVLPQAVAPTSTTVDLVIYGATAQGICAAIEARRRGLTVAVVGGWRDHQVGGMSSGGLSFVDFDTPSALGGIVRTIITKSCAILGVADGASQKWTPKSFRLALQSLCDASRSGGQDVPIYWSNGVASASKTGTRVTSLTTSDGRTFTGAYFIDASYEGDVVRVAGLSALIGREAAGSGSEAINGFRGLLIGSASNQHQFENAAQTAIVDVDPYVTPGTPGSGLLPGVDAIPALANGAADDRTQDYNFRMTLVTTPSKRVPMPATPPAGYNVTTYEPLLRWLALVPTTAMEGIFNLDTVQSLIVDCNADGGFSSDLHGGGTRYTQAATYAAREVIWQEHANFIRGLWYVLQYEADARVPAALRTEALTYGYASDHYLSPSSTDRMWWPTQLYVREMRRLTGDYIHNANDIAAVDGTTPRSIKTVAIASYAMDSHHNRMMADPAIPRIWNEGNVFLAGGGADHISPIPYEAMLPKASECTNLLTPWSVSSTHSAFGSIRMEDTSMLLAQASAVAVKVAKDAGGIDLALVDYPTLRTALLSVADVVPPSLPQVN